MEDIFYPGMPDWLDTLNQLAKGQLQPIQVDWSAAPGSVKAIANKPALAAVATSGNKADVGLDRADNTSDASKPISDAQQVALDLKAPKDSPTFTGSVKGITKAMVGLDKADNTSDAAKPVSTAQQTALDLKQDKLSFTPVQNGTGFGQVPASIVKIGFTGPTLNRIKATVDSTDFGNFAMEGAANTFTQVQMFGGRAGASSSTFNPATTDWVKAALCTQGTKGGGVAVIDNANSAGGCIWAEGAVLRFGTGTFSSGTPPVLDVQAGFVTPATDNSTSLASFNRRWGNSYFSVAPTITSDAREKDMFRAFEPAEIAAAGDLARAIGVYRWKTAVALKGDGAREHIGPTVQVAIQIMESHGLDPFNYGFICYDSWKGETIEHVAVEATDDREMQAAWTETIPAGDRYAFRYDELNQFIAAGLEARQASVEARLAALERTVP